MHLLAKNIYIERERKKKRGKEKERESESESERETNIDHVQEKSAAPRK